MFRDMVITINIIINEEEPGSIFLDDLFWLSLTEFKLRAFAEFG